MESTVLDERFLLAAKLGSGSFGEIYEAECLDTGITVAVKLEKHKPDKESRLLYEARLYRLLLQLDHDNICRIYHSGKCGDWNYMVMEKLSYSLEQLFQQCQRAFSVKTVCLIAKAALSRLEILHNHGYVHRDLKPDNFMVGYGPKFKTIYLIDLGLAKAFINPITKEHVIRKGGKSLVGTARYVSLSSHDGYQQSRKDDLESLGYLLLYFLKGSLPWQGMKVPVKTERFKKIALMKKAIPLSKMWEDFPCCFLEYCQYVQSMDYESQPDYQHLRSLFSQKDCTLDWEQKLAPPTCT